MGAIEVATFPRSLLVQIRTDPKIDCSIVAASTAYWQGVNVWDRTVELADPSVLSPQMAGR